MQTQRCYTADASDELRGPSSEAENVRQDLEIPPLTANLPPERVGAYSAARGMTTKAPTAAACRQCPSDRVPTKKACPEILQSAPAAPSAAAVDQLVIPGNRAALLK